MKNGFGCLIACVWMLAVSQASGNFLLKNTELGQKKFARTGLGFFAFLAVYQMLILPAQLFHFSTIWLCAAFLLESMAVLWLERKNLVQLLKESWKELAAVFLMGIVAMGLSVLYTDSLITNGLADHWFYIKFIRENADLTSYVNLYNPVNGMDTMVQDIYAFSGLHHLYSALSAVFRVEPLFFTLWFGTWMMHALASAVHFFLLNWWPCENKWMKLVVLVSLVEAFTGGNLEYGYLPTYFRTAAGGTMLVIFLLARYAQSENRLYIKLTLMMNVALMACQSTHFFISVALTLALCVYEIFFRSNRSVPYFTMLAAPCLMYACCLMIYENNLFVFCMLIAVFVGLNMVYHWIKNWKGYPAFVLSVLIVLALAFNGVGFLFSNPVVSFQQALSHFSSLYFSNADAFSWSGMLNWAKVLLRWLVVAGVFVSLMHCRQLKSEYRWMMVMLAVLFVYFYNPFAVVGVSTFLTGEVYTRFASLADSYAVLLMSVSLFSLQKPQRFLGAVMMCLMLLAGSGRVISEAKKAALLDFGQMNASMLMYRIDDEMMEMGLFLNQYSEERLSIVYPKTINRFMLMTDQLVFSNVMPSFSQMRYDQEINFQDWTDNSLRNQIQAFLMAPELYFTDYYYQFDPQRVPDFQNMMVLSDTDLFVISKWKGEESHQTFDHCLQSFSYLIYESDMYQIYRIYR